MSDLQLRRLNAGDAGFGETLDALLAWDSVSDEAVASTVAAVLADIRQRGDAAVLEYTRRFDAVEASNVSELEFSACLLYTSDAAEHLALGSSHIDIAGTDNLIDTRNRFRAKGQRRDSLSTTDRKQAIHPGNGRRGQHHVVHIAVGRGRHGDQLAHSGHLGRNSIHQHRRRIGRLAAWHIQSHSVHTANLLTQYRAVVFLVLPGRLLLALVITADTIGRLF